MSTTRTDCLFCNIIEGRHPSDKVYEDDLTVAFWDINPVRPVHILIVPKEHIPTLNDIVEDNHILAHVGQVARKIAEDFGVDQSGYRLFINVNRGGGQVIFHLHAHLIAKKATESD